MAVNNNINVGNVELGEGIVEAIKRKLSAWRKSKKHHNGIHTPKNKGIE